MPLTRIELEAMEKTLQEAFRKAREGFEMYKDYPPYDEHRRENIKAVSVAASALLEVDRRLNALDESPVTKLPASKMPGKA